MAVPAQNESRTPIASPQMTKREIGQAIREFQARLNEDLGVPALRHPRGAKLSPEDVIRLMQLREHLPAQQVVVDGRRYARLCEWGNPASEALVRQNLKQFISEARRVIRESVARKELGLLLDMCRSYEDGIRLADFFTKAGTELGKNRAFGEAIKQFFKDEQMVLKIVLVALDEIKKALGAAKVQIQVPLAGQVGS